LCWVFFETESCKLVFLEALCQGQGSKTKYYSKDSSCAFICKGLGTLCQGFEAETNIYAFFFSSWRGILIAANFP
jgi:hypothetical protein